MIFVDFDICHGMVSLQKIVFLDLFFEGQQFEMLISVMLGSDPAWSTGFSWVIIRKSPACTMHKS